MRGIWTVVGLFALAVIAVAIAWWMTSREDGAEKKEGSPSAARVPAAEATGREASMVTPNPRSIKVEIDKSRTQSAEITEAGGTVTVAGGQGIVYTLAIPEGALLKPTNISLTPVTEIKGLPFSDGFVASVHLEPEGLQLYDYAMLHVKVPAGFNRDRLTGFGYHGGGKEFHLRPLTDVGDAGFVLPIIHFSGYGASEVTAEERAIQQDFLPTRPDDQAAQYLSDTMPTSEQNEYFSNWYQQVVKPNLERAVHDPDSFESAFAGVTQWHRTAILLGAEDSTEAQAAEGWQLAAKAAETYVSHHGELCRESFDFEKVSNLFKLARYSILVPYVFSQEQVEEQLTRCLSFELDFESRITVTYPYEDGFTGRETVHVRSRIPLSTALSGAAPIEYLEFRQTNAGEGCSYRYPGYDIHAVTVATTDEVRGIEWTVLADGMANMRLQFDPGWPGELIQEVCDGVEYETSEEHLWVSTFLFLHEEEYITYVDENREDREVLIISGWEPAGGDVLARRTYSRTLTEGADTYTEATVFNLLHTPK